MSIVVIFVFKSFTFRRGSEVSPVYVIDLRVIVDIQNRTDILVKINMTPGRLLS